MNQVTPSPEHFDVFEEFAVDPVLDIEGARFDMGKGAWVLVAQAENRKYNRAFAKALETHREALAKQDDAADELSNRIMAEVFADTILKGFGGLSYKGKPVEYSRAVAVEMLMHQRFRVRIGQFANDQAAYKHKLEVEQGNA